MKKYYHLIIIITLLLFGVSVTAQTPQGKTPEERVLDRDFTRMMAWFPGVYDNQEQVYFENEMGVKKEHRHERLHHIFAPVKLKHFPGRTFYVQQSIDDDPKNIYRQRIYSFETDYTENAIRLTIYTPKNAEALVDAHLDPDKIKNLRPSAMTSIKGCEVFWKFDADFYHGYMKPRACKIISKRSGKTIYIDDDLRLTKNSIWVRDVAEDEDGNYVFGNKANVHHKNLKARAFKCWVSPQKADDSNGFYANLPIHDQGGRIWIEAVDGEHGKVGIKMRNVAWPYGRNRPSLVLYAYRGDEPDKAVSYSWTSPDGTRIAMNLRWIQASCTLDNTGFFKTQ